MFQNNAGYAKCISTEGLNRYFLPNSICERVTPRLSHANSAVVLSAVKVLMKFMEMLSKDLDYYGTLLKKLAPPLVTLLSAEPELQYVALRNINLIVQKRYIKVHAVLVGKQYLQKCIKATNIYDCLVK